MGLGMLGGLGLGSIGLGMGLNFLQGDPYSGINGQIDREMRNVRNREAPQAGPAQTAVNSGFRDNQRSLISRLEALASGQGPSLATEQLRQATQRNAAQQQSIASSGRGNAALAGIQASNMAGQLGAQAGSDAATARIAEQQMALQQLGGVIGQGRAQDQETSQFNALAQNYRDKDNLEAKLRMQGYNDEQIRNMLMLRSQNVRPSMGDQLMAGGAGLLALGASRSGSRT